jgi:hypothetical protein
VPAVRSHRMPDRNHQRHTKGEYQMSKTQQLKLHLACLIRNPRAWRFYAQGITRALTHN